MQGKTLYTILLSIIAVLTLALAVLIVILFTYNAGKTLPVKQNVQRTVPPEEQAVFRLYGSSERNGSNDAVFNIKNDDKHPNSFIMASISIIYDGGKRNKHLEKRTELIERVYLSQLKQATIEYFRGKTFDELQESDAMEDARKNLMETFNNILSNEGTEEPFIIKVVFDKWIIQ